MKVRPRKITAKQFGVQTDSEGVLWLLQGRTPPQNALGLDVDVAWHPGTGSGPRGCPHELKLTEITTDKQHPLSNDGAPLWIADTKENCEAVEALMKGYNPPGPGIVPAPGLLKSAMMCSNIMPLVLRMHGLIGLDRVQAALAEMSYGGRRVVVIGIASAYKNPPAPFEPFDPQAVYDPSADYSGMIVSTLIRRMQDAF